MGTRVNLQGSRFRRESFFVRGLSLELRRATYPRPRTPAKSSWFLALALVGCSSSKSTGFVEQGNDAGLLGADAAPACSAAATLVYVVSELDTLYGFHPDTLTFAQIGTLRCPVPTDTQPNSMTVDRNGVAWVG